MHTIKITYPVEIRFSMKAQINYKFTNNGEKKRAHNQISQKDVFFFPTVNHFTQHLKNIFQKTSLQKICLENVRIIQVLTV